MERVASLEAEVRSKFRCRSKTRTTTLRGGGEGKQTSDRHFDLCTDRTRLIGSSPPKGKSHNGSSRSRILGSDRKLLLHSQSWHIFSLVTAFESSAVFENSFLDYQIFPVAATTEQSPLLYDRLQSGCNAMVALMFAAEICCQQRRAAGSGSGTRERGGWNLSVWKKVSTF